MKKGITYFVLFIGSLYLINLLTSFWHYVTHNWVSKEHNVLVVFICGIIVIMFVIMIPVTFCFFIQCITSIFQLIKKIYNDLAR
ncbi:hypothetical protein BCF58_0133 [Chryseobacterium defluvii]|uniref:Uncharacterized protein n=1 Tax=Chryseobacterium defluvii TaxID=160396 RepID=A0A495SKY3_9FLAO|nr:hypothetical protein BCF58_0133 [Chryseobacterium defluvii]